MGLLANGNIEGSIPAVKLDVHLDGAVIEASAHKDLLSLITLLAVKREGSVAGGLTRQFLNIIDVLDFISLINYSESNLKGIQFAAVNSHGGKARPKSLFLDEATKADSLLEIRLFHMLVQNSWVGRDCKSGETTIKPAYFAEVASEADHLRELSNFRGFADSARFLHKVLVHINGIRVEPCNVLAVADAAEHIIRFVPHEGINHVLNFLDFRFVNLGQEHVTVAVDEAHLPFTGHFDLIQIHFDDLGRVLDRICRRLTRLDIEDANDLGLSWIN